MTQRKTLAPPQRRPERRAPEGAPRQEPSPAAAAGSGRGMPRYLAGPGVVVSRPDDAQEREANAAAVGFSGGVPRPPAPPISPVPRPAAPGGTPEGPVAAAIRAQRGGGEAIATPVRGRMEAFFGHDLGNVRLHRGPQADRLARRLGAAAFTHGQDVFFRGGAPAPESAGGGALLAHEVAHALQQGMAPPASGPVYAARQECRVDGTMDPLPEETADPEVCEMEGPPPDLRITASPEGPVEAGTWVTYTCEYDGEFEWRLENDAGTYDLYHMLSPDLPLRATGPGDRTWQLVAAYPGTHHVKAVITADGVEMEADYAQVVSGSAHTDLHAELAAAAAAHPPSEVVEWTTWDIVVWKTPLMGSYVFSVKEQWVTAYRDAISAAAARFDLPPVLVAGVAYNEVGGDPQWIDSIAHGVRSFDHLADPVLEPLTITRRPELTSFGNVSMQIRRAAETLGYDPTSLTSEQEDMIIQSLEDPETNIFIAAAHLAQLRDIDFPGVGAAAMTDDQISVVATRFNRGPDLSLEAIQANLSYGSVLIGRAERLRGMLGPE